MDVATAAEVVGFCESCDPPVLGWAQETTNLAGCTANRLGSVGLSRCNPPVLGWAHETKNLVGFIANRLGSVGLGLMSCAFPLLAGPSNVPLPLLLGGQRVLVITYLVFVKAVTHPFSVGPTRLQILLGAPRID